MNKVRQPLNVVPVHLTPSLNLSILNGPSYIPAIARSHKEGTKLEAVRPDQRSKSLSHRDGCYTGGSGVKSTPYMNDDGHLHGFRL